MITSTPKHIQCFQKSTCNQRGLETLGCQLHTQVIYNRKINKLISIIDFKKNPDGKGTRGITVKAQTSGTNKFIVTLIIDLNLPI